MAIITISRQFGAGGDIVADVLSKELGFMLIDRYAISQALHEMCLPADLSRIRERNMSKDDMDKKRRFILTAIHDYLFDLAKNTSFILLGQGGQYLFRDSKDSLHLLVYASGEQRVQWIQEVRKLDRTQALHMVREQDRQRKRFLKQLFDQDWLTVDAYDLCLNTGKLTLSAASRIAIDAAKGFLHSLEKNTLAISEQLPQEQASNAHFMHSSEAEFARILDYYNITWEYEPQTFPLAWDELGRVTAAFTPDFYLTEHDLYVELTTQRQKLVWRKNKKARCLRELYPNINIKVVYNREFKHLLESFGIETDKPMGV